ncbi:MAG: DUF2971 domain-containing protein [Pseudomonadota bacterium]
MLSAMVTGRFWQQQIFERKVPLPIDNYCHIHHSGAFDTPCAWPGCANGHDGDEFISNFGPSPKKYHRDFLHAEDGEPRYFWISDSQSYGWLIRNLLQNELSRLAPQSSPIIYHYTSLDGFRGIIESEDMWLTESAFLNDASEVIHGMQISQEIFKTLQIESEPIKGYLSDVIHTPIDKRPRINIGCFSNARNNLSQWRGYGGDVGISIGFEVKSFMRAFGYPDCKLGSVLYDEEKKRSLIKTFFLFYCEAYRRDLNRTIKVLQRDMTRKDHLPITGYDTGIHSLYFELITACKHSDFVDEHEVRLFYAEYSETLNWANLSSAKTRFRKGNGFLAPYTTIEDIRISRQNNYKKERLPIDEVMIGPSPSADLAAISVRRFLDNQGYSNIPVRTSTSPYR